MKFKNPAANEQFKNDISKTEEQVNEEEALRKAKGLRKMTYKEFKQEKMKKR